MCVRGNVRVAEGIDSLPSSFPSDPVHPVVGDGSLKRGARDHLRVCVFVGFLCVNNFSFAVFAVSPPTWSHCKYFPYRLQQMMMLVIALPLHNDVDIELEGGRNRLWTKTTLLRNTKFSAKCCLYMYSSSKLVLFVRPLSS